MVETDFSLIFNRFYAVRWFIGLSLLATPDGGSVNLHEEITRFTDKVRYTRYTEHQHITCEYYRLKQLKEKSNMPDEKVRQQISDILKQRKQFKDKTKKSKTNNSRSNNNNSPANQQTNNNKRASVPHPDAPSSKR